MKEFMSSNLLEEVFSDEARIQLKFSSYMKISSLICFFISLVATIVARSFVTTEAASDVDSASIIIWITVYTFLGSFLISLFGAAISFPVYSYFCSKFYGQRVYGKFAILVNRNEKNKDSHEPPL